ncbi:MAG: hypothetical protein ACK4FS_05840, partial [Flavobacterium sp.]
MKRNYIFLGLLFLTSLLWSQPWSLYASFNLADNGAFGDVTNNSVRTTAIQSDGKIIIGGNFTSYDGQVKHRIARVNGVAVTNDECIHAAPITLTSENQNIAFALADKTVNNEPGCSGSTPENLVDEWYSFAMPFDGNIVITSSTNFNRFSLTTTCGGEEIVCFNGSGVINGLTGGTFYRLRVFRTASQAANLIFQNFNIQAFPAAENDTCTTASGLTVSNTLQTVNFNLQGALGAVESGCSGTDEEVFHDLWFSFTMPYDGNVAITTPIVWNRFAVFDACGGNEILCFVGNKVISNLEEGATYYLRVYRTEALAINANFQRFTIQSFPAAPNEDCANASPIVVSTTLESVNFDLQSAFVFNEEGCVGSDPANYADLWYEFSMPFDGNVAITSQMVWNRFTLYDACDGNEISCFVGNNLVTGLVAGATYKLRVYRTEALALDSSFQSFSIQAFESAENDVCSTATPLGVSTSQQLINFVMQGASLNNEPACEGSNPAVYADLWYEFTMPVEGSIVLTTPNPWTRFSLFDSCEGNEITCFEGNGTIEGLQFGATYKLRVYRNLSTTLNPAFQRFTIQAFGIVPNDACSGALNVVLDGSVQEVPFTITGASLNNEPGCSETASQNFADVWFAFTMPFDGSLSINGSISWNQFAVYDSCNGEELSCFDTGGLVEGLSEGVTYLVRVFRTETLAINPFFQSFTVQAIEASIVFPPIGMVGTFNGFDNDVVMETLDGELYTLNDFEFSVTGVVKFRQDFSWDVNWGATDFPTGIGFQGGPDIPVPAGVYDITFNRLTGAYQFTLLNPLFSNVGIIGEFNGWSISVPMQTIDGENYSLLNFSVPAPGLDPGLKFRQDNSWDINWGGSSFPIGIASLNGPNIPIPEGTYNIYFNLLSLEYTFEDITFQTWYEDFDGDGFGNPDVST